jgi:integrase/recombinase XerD
VQGFPVRLPSGVTYWTVLDRDLAVVPEADRYLRHVRFGQDGAELTTRSYAGAIALYLRWCERTGRDWRTAAEHMALFMTWLRHAPADGGSDSHGEVLAGPGMEPVRGERRVNLILAAARGFLLHAAGEGSAPSDVVAMLYEVADSRDVPRQVRGESTGPGYRLKARHHLREPSRPADRASDEEIVALLRACLSCRDRLIVLLMARAGLRRGEVTGLRRRGHPLHRGRELPRLPGAAVSPARGPAG